MRELLDADQFAEGLGSIIRSDLEGTNVMEVLIWG